LGVNLVKKKIKTTLVYDSFLNDKEEEKNEQCLEKYYFGTFSFCRDQFKK